MTTTSSGISATETSMIKFKDVTPKWAVALIFVLCIVAALIFADFTVWPHAEKESSGNNTLG
jgi:hypothetical protein